VVRAIESLLTGAVILEISVPESIDCDEVDCCFCGIRPPARTGSAPSPQHCRQLLLALRRKSMGACQTSLKSMSRITLVCNFRGLVQGLVSHQTSWRDGCSVQPAPCPCFCCAMGRSAAVPWFPKGSPQHPFGTVTAALSVCFSTPVRNSVCWRPSQTAGHGTEVTNVPQPEPPRPSRSCNGLL
jgi:hypothetical protein